MNLRDFVDLLDKKGMLLHVTKPVDVKYEISTIVKMLEGKPVIFEHVRGFSMPVVSNVCSTRDLVCLGLGMEKKELIHRLTQAIDHPKQPKVEKAHGYEEVDDLTKLPILTYYPKDGGPYIASGIAFAKDNEYGLNASYHRAMVIGKDKLVLRILERHLNEYVKRGLKEFAFCVGNPTPVLIGAAISAELGKSELAIANALHETKAVELDGHVVPESEIVMICEFTGEQADEGPFLDLTETFDIVRKQSVVKVKKIYVKKDAVFHALLPGDLEHKILMGMPREPTMFREVAKVCECLDVYVTPGGCSWLHGAVKIRKKNEDDGRKAIEAAFIGHASMKHVFVVDEDIDIEKPNEIEWAMATRFQGDRDLVIKPKEKGSSLDPSSDMKTRETTKVGFDLTAPMKTTGKDFKRPELPMKLELEDYVKL
jgi:UbiD family decarboxylase